MPSPRGLRAAGCHLVPCACRGLRDNRLSGTIPTELGRLTNLRNSVCARARPVSASRAWPRARRPLCRGHPRGAQVPRPQFAQRHAPKPARDADQAALLFVRRRHRQPSLPAVARASVSLLTLSGAHAARRTVHTNQLSGTVPDELGSERGLNAPECWLTWSADCTPIHVFRAWQPAWARHGYYNDEL